MPAWAISIVVSLVVGLIMFLVNKLTFKSAADIDKRVKGLEDCIEQLKKDGWTTEQRVALNERLVRLDERQNQIREEVDFTKTSHQEFLRLLEKALIPVAHSPHTPELDRLLEKRDRDEVLSADEWEELIRRLEEQSGFYEDLPGKKVALRGLLAIYKTHLRAARRREGLLEA